MTAINDYINVRTFRKMASDDLPWPPRDLLGSLHDESATAHGVDEHIATLEEWVVTPGASELHGTATLLVIVLGVDIEVGDLLDPLARGIPEDRAKIDDAVAERVVALVRESVDDELVVVDTPSRIGILAGLLGVLEVRDVPDV